MASYYDTLGVTKNSTEAEIKKAYKKLAMQYHPDRNKGDKKAESKFKEINEAYQTLGDSKKKKEYDQFGQYDASGFRNNQHTYGSTNRTNSNNSFDFGDIFSQFGNGGRKTDDFGSFDINDLFGNMGERESSNTENHKETVEKISNLDITETVEIPFLDFLYDTSVNIRTLYGKNLSLKIKSGSQPGTKYKISGKGRTMEGKTGDMYVIVNAKMPKEIPASLQPMIDALRQQL